MARHILIRRGPGYYIAPSLAASMLRLFEYDGAYENVRVCHQLRQQLAALPLTAAEAVAVDMTPAQSRAANRALARFGASTRFA